MAEKKSLSTITGTVVRGAGRGKKLGFPTANLALPESVARPETGVYAAWAKLAKTNKLFPAAVHVGPAPTFERAANLIEVHLLNFPDQDLYDTKITVSFMQKIRNVQSFATTEALIIAITEDCAAVLHLLNTATQKN